MKYDFNGKVLNIPDTEIENSMKALGLTKEEAVDLWLDDNDYTEDEEQTALDNKAKKVKVDHGAESETKRKKSDKPKVVKISDEKTQIFKDIHDFLAEKYDIEVVTNNKLIEINLNGKNFKLNLSETRAKKS